MTVAQLGYLGFEVSSLDAWESFTTQILGLTVEKKYSNGEFRLQLDSHAYRLLITQGNSDDLSVVGWETQTPEHLYSCIQRLERSGIPVKDSTPKEREARAVQSLFKLTDPEGIPIELYYKPAYACSPFESNVLLTRFVADYQGLGHIVLGTQNQKESIDFYTQLLGLRLTDYIRCQMYGYPIDIAFLHANSRHHSVAFGGKQAKRLHHFMLEVQSIDDVGLCYDRCVRNGIPIMQTLGRHPNDKMFSFYAQTPSGFQFEFGFGGLQVEDKNWEVTTHNCVSEWGHHPPKILSPRKK